MKHSIKTLWGQAGSVRWHGLESAPPARRSIGYPVECRAPRSNRVYATSMWRWVGRFGLSEGVPSAYECEVFRGIRGLESQLSMYGAPAVCVYLVTDS